MVDKTPVKSQIEKKLSQFNRIAYATQILFISFALLSVITSLIVATFSTELERKGILKYFAYTAALSSSIISAFSLNTKSSDSRRAWRLLNITLMRHTSNPDSTSEDDLINAYFEAEEALGDIIFNYPRQASNILKIENEELKNKLDEIEEKVNQISSKNCDEKNV